MTPTLHDAVRRDGLARLPQAYTPCLFPALLAPHLGPLSNLLNTHAPRCGTTIMEHTKLDTQEQVTVKIIESNNCRN